MKHYLLDADIFVYYEKLPWKIHGMVSTNSDDTYTVVLNSRLHEALQLAALVHEIRHIQKDDFYGFRSIEEVECL